jgi:hypothetical protein
LYRPSRVDRGNIHGMQDSLWYRQKADECARLAKDASEPHRRQAHETQERLWLRIADQIEANEDAARSAR